MLSYVKEMTTQTSSSKTNNFLTTPLGILVAIIFFPFFFTYWIYKRNWNPKIKWAFMIGFWSLIFIAEITDYPQKTTLSKPNTSVEKIQPAKEISQAVSPAFDKNLGNNYIAAKYAKQFMDFANQMSPGVIRGIYLELLPSDPAGRPEEDYKKSISASSLTVIVNPLYWNIANNSTKKSFITTSLNEMKKLFFGSPRLTINNGSEIVATGELSPKGDPIITLN